MGKKIFPNNLSNLMPVPPDCLDRGTCIKKLKHLTVISSILHRKHDANFKYKEKMYKIHNQSVLSTMFATNMAVTMLFTNLFIRSNFLLFR